MQRREKMACNALARTLRTQFTTIFRFSHAAALILNDFKGWRFMNTFSLTFSPMFL